MAAAVLAVAGIARGQSTAPAPAPAVTPAVSPDLIGRRVDDVRVEGNSRVSSQQILNSVRTRVGQPFDPVTVESDYQRVFALKRFSDVQARVEPQAGGGVAVVFRVAEERLIHQVRFVGNRAIPTEDLAKGVDVKAGEAIENFRIALAKRAIDNAYRAKNYPYTHVDVDPDEVARTGDLVFRITEAQPVAIRNIEFVGLRSFTYGKMKDQIQTTRQYWILNAGTCDPRLLDADVASVRRFYRDHGFFDVKVGRKVIVSPDQTEVQVDFLIDEGPRYTVAKVTFTGVRAVPESVLRQRLRLVPGQTFDADTLGLDVKDIVKAYSPLGYIYDPRTPDPEYLRIGRPADPYPAHLVYRDRPGTVELVYDVAEGRPFRIGRIEVVGNERTQQKLALRELRVQPGQLYDSGELADAAERLQGTPYYGRPNGSASITPIPPAGGEPGTRDVLVQVKDNTTANVQAGAAVNSSLGLTGNFVYEQKNFDLLNGSLDPRDVVGGHAWTGAGQDFRVTFQPGTQVTSGSVLFSEPYLFDLPYSLTTEGYYQQYIREAWYEQHAGGSVTFGKQFDYVYSAAVTAQAEDVDIRDVQDFFPVADRVDVVDPVTHQPRLNAGGTPQTQLRSVRAPDVLIHAGHNLVTNLGLTLRRDTTNRGPLTYDGSSATAKYQLFGALGGDYHFHEFNLGYDQYATVYRDLLDRRTVVAGHLQAGYITPGAPFFDRFYGGGIGSLRGFQYRGVGPRAGRDRDPIGGNFNLVGTVEVTFPVYGDTLRGVIFDDFGTVEPDIRIRTIRDSVGVGVRVVIPFLGPNPLAFDVAFPITKEPQDIRQVFSFGLRT